MQPLISGSYSAFNEGFNGAGIYLASGLFDSNTFQKPIYVGSATDLRRRVVREHLPDLTSNIHANRPFQNAYNRHGGETAFVWFLLETCQPNETLEREQYWLDTLRPFCDELRGFNIQHDAKGGGKGRIVSEETRRKQSLALKGKTRTEETKARIRLAKLGRTLSAEAKARIGAATSKRTGWKHSEDTKRKISESAKARRRKR